MKRSIRTTLAIIAQCVLVACGNSDADNITDVLTRCAQISEKPAGFSPGLKAKIVAEAFQNMDVSRCPPDFRAAFREHVFAWQQAAPYFANENVATSIFEKLAANTTQDSQLAGQAGQQAARKINETYEALVKIAEKHGARIPQSGSGL